MSFESSSLGSIEQKVRYKIIEKIRKISPTNSYYIFFLILLKFLGISVITHNRITSTSNNSNIPLAYYLRRLLYFQNLFIDTKSYSYLCIIIYTYITLTLIFIFFYWRNYAKNYVKKKYRKNERKSLLKKFIIYGLSFMINLIIFFSQHMLEILAIIYTEFQISSTYEAPETNKPDINFINLKIFLEKLESNLLLSKYIVFVLNFIFIVIINCICYFYFKFINEPFICSDYNMKFSNNKNFITFFILLSNLTGIHYIDIIIPNIPHVKIIQLVICLVILIFILHSYEKFLVANLINFLVLSISLYFIISIILELVIYFTNNENEITLKVSILRVVVESCLAILICIHILNHKRIRNSNLIPDLIFNKNKIMTLESLSELIYILKRSVTNINHLYIFFKIINKHMYNCQIGDCLCRIYKLENFIDRLKILKSSATSHDEKKLNNFHNSFYELILLVENQITKAIYNIANKNLESLDKIEDYLILHLDFILYFRRKTQLCIYFKNRYSRLKLKDFMFNFYLHLIEKKIIEIEKEGISLHDENISKGVKYLEIFKYINQLTYLQNLMIKNSENYENLIKIKKMFNIKVLKGSVKFDSNSKINTEHLLNACLVLNRDYQNLKLIIIEEFHLNNLKNVELCFLIYNFYALLDRHIPEEIQSNFISIPNYNSLKQFDTSFEEKGMQHPMILTITNKNLLISYISQKICDHLGYKRSDLLGEDFHRLLPSQISNEHSRMIKKLLLCDKKFQFKKEAFALTKNGYYFPLNIVVSVLPALSENVYIADLQPINQSSDDETSILIFLDQDFNIITINKKFEDNFFMSLEMIRTMKISILHLFEINENQIVSVFNDSLDDLSNQFNHWENLIEILKSSDLKDVLEDEKNLIEKIGTKIIKSNKFEENYLRSKIFYRRKKIMIPYLQKLQSMILENELPKEWLTKISNFEINSFKQISYLKYNSKGLIKVNTRSNGNSDNFFKIEVQLRNIINLPYYVIRIAECEENCTKNIIRDKNYKRKGLFMDRPLSNISEDNVGKVHNYFNDDKLSENDDEKLENKISEYESGSESDSQLQSDLTFSNKSSSSYINIEKDSFKKSGINLVTELESFNKNYSEKKESVTILDEKLLKHSSLNLPSPRVIIDSRENSTEKFISSSFSKKNSLTKKISSNFERPSKFNKTPLVPHSKADITDTSSIFSYSDNTNKNYTTRRFRRRIDTSNKLKRNKKMKFNFFFLFGFLIVLNLMSIYNVIFSSEKLENSLTLYKVNYNCIALKTTVIYTGSAVISSCLNSEIRNINHVDGFTVTLKDFKDILSRRSKEMTIYKNKLISDLNDAANIPGVHELYDIMNSYLNYSLFTENWQKYSRNSTLLDEIDFFHYYVKMLQNFDNSASCKIGQFEKKSNNYANLVERVSHYVIKNLEPNMGAIFRKLTSGSAELLSMYQNQSIEYLVIYNSCIMLVFLVLSITVIISIVYYRKKINLVLKKLFKIKEEDYFFERKLSNLKNILISLDKNVCEAYEEEKLNISKEITLIKEIKLNSSKYENTNLSDTKSNLTTINSSLTPLSNFKLNPINLIKIKKSENSLSREGEPGEIENFFINHQILKEKEKIFLNDQENFGNYFYISFVKRSFIILGIFSLLYLSLVMFNINSNINDFKKILFATKISDNFMDRIPRFAELILYYKISILINNVNYLTKPQKEYSFLTKSVNIFDVPINLKDHSLYQILGDSSFCYLLFKLKLERSTIQIFMDDKYEGILPTVRKYENLINNKNPCVEIALYNQGYIFNRDYPDYVDFRKEYKAMSSGVTECKTINSGMNLNGISLVMDNHITWLETLFLEFATNTVGKTPQDFFTDKNFLRAQLNAEYTLKRAQNGFLSILENDILNNYQEIIFKEYIFSALKIIFALTFIIYFIFMVIFKLQNYAYNLKIGINRFKTAVG
jgi:PAS domain S-box-containing protein